MGGRTFSYLIIIPSTLDIQHNNFKRAKPIHEDIFLKKERQDQQTWRKREEEKALLHK